MHVPHEALPETHQQDERRQRMAGLESSNCRIIVNTTIPSTVSIINTHNDKGRSMLFIMATVNTDRRETEVNWQTMNLAFKVNQQTNKSRSIDHRAYQ